MRSLSLLAVWLAVVLVTGCIVEAPSESPAEAVTRLSVLLSDPSPDIRRTAAQALGKLGRAEGVRAVRDAAHDEDPLVRQYSAWALGMIGEPAREATEVLIALLNDPAPGVAEAAAWAIGQLGATDRVVRELSHALRAGEATRRRAAVTALGWLEAPASYPALVAALDDADRDVRQGAVGALGELGDRRAVPELIARLQRDADPGVRNEAAYRLGKLGDRRAESALRDAARDARTARWAMWALRELGSEGSEGGTTSSRGASAS